MTTLRRLLFSVACLLLSISGSFAFVVAPSAVAPTTTTTTSLHYSPPVVLDFSSHHLLAVETVDPTAVLSNALGGFINSPAILAIPIVAALAVASLLAFLIVSYASPAVEDDE